MMVWCDASSSIKDTFSRLVTELTLQEAIALDESAVKGPDYKKLYYMPAPADR